jgi:hypothetical protein
MFGLNGRRVCSVWQLAQWLPSAGLLAAATVLLGHVTIVQTLSMRA